MLNSLPHSSSPSIRHTILSCFSPASWNTPYKRKQSKQEEVGGEDKEDKEISKMQRIISRSRILSRGLGSHSNRCFSQLLSQRADGDVNIPKMPPFDYTPPPYEGPSSAEILQKRREFLSPSMFYFYNNPVSCLSYPPPFIMFFFGKTPILSLSLSI